MKIKLIAVVTSIALLLIACTNSQTTSSPTAGGASEEVSGAPQETGLQVYYVKGVTPFEMILSEFKIAHPEIVVDAVSFDSEEMMDSQITSQLSAGTCPDVILFTNYTTLDTVKMENSGTFRDLSVDLAADESFVKEKYYPILDAGLVNDKQILMPLAFRLQYLLSSEEKLSKVGMELEENYTIKDLFSAMNVVANACDDLHSLASQAVYVENRGELLYDYLRLTGVPLVNYADSQIVMNKEDIEQYAEYTKMLYEQFEKAELLIKDYRMDFISTFERVALIPTQDQLALNARLYSSIFAEGLKEKMKILTYPNQENAESLTANVMLYAAVSSGAENPESAYQFLRFGMDLNYGSSSSVLSANKDAVQLVLDDLCKYSGKSTSVGSTRIMINSMDEEVRAEVEGLLNRISCGSILNNAILMIIAESMDAYMTGSKDFETCYSDLENKLQLYLYE